MFGACFMVVTDPRPWGAQGYIQVIGTRDGPGGLAYYRARWEEMELVGAAGWIAGSLEGETDEY
jgi:hypothetical protein